MTKHVIMTMPLTMPTLLNRVPVLGMEHGLRDQPGSDAHKEFEHASH